VLPSTKTGRLPLFKIASYGIVGDLFTVVPCNPRVKKGWDDNPQQEDQEVGDYQGIGFEM